MYLSEPERKEIINTYFYECLVEDGHYQVEPDTWVYLFHDSNDKKYVLITADYLDFYFDHLPHILRFENNEFYKIEFILKKEILSQNPEKTTNSALFEYTSSK